MKEGHYGCHKTKTDYKEYCEGISCRLDSVLPLQGAWVSSLVRELRSCTPRSVARKYSVVAWKGDTAGVGPGGRWADAGSTCGTNRQQQTCRQISSNQVISLIHEAFEDKGE